MSAMMNGSCRPSAFAHSLIVRRSQLAMLDSSWLLQAPCPAGRYAVYFLI
jgi:hypothetical protein